VEILLIAGINGSTILGRKGQMLKDNIVMTEISHSWLKMLILGKYK